MHEAWLLGSGEQYSASLLKRPGPWSARPDALQNTACLADLKSSGPVLTGRALGKQLRPEGSDCSFCYDRERWTALPRGMALTTCRYMLSQSPYCLGNNSSHGGRAQ